MFDTFTQKFLRDYTAAYTKRQRLKWELTILSALGYYRTYVIIYDMLKYNIRGINKAESWVLN